MAVSPRSAWTFRCPWCRAPALKVSNDSARCVECQRPAERQNGVVVLLDDSEKALTDEKVSAYTRVRLAEGRGDYDRNLLRELPGCPAGHQFAHEWRIRKRSCLRLTKLLGNRLGAGSRILDLGAGNGWLSHRLRQQQLHPCAVDLSANPDDGLGAARAYDPDWPRLLAQFDRLPLLDDSVDGIIFNASLHYSSEPRATLAESLRVLRKHGLLIILDTPIYRDATSGRSMLEESYRYFEDLVGDRSDSVGSIGFLTYAMLDDLGRDLGLDWQFDYPWYGMRWAMRPWLARLRGKREPATFAIVWASKR